MRGQVSTPAGTALGVVRRTIVRQNPGSD
jgi:hypothetical protein